MYWIDTSVFELLFQSFFSTDSSMLFQELFDFNVVVSNGVVKRRVLPPVYGAHVFDSKAYEVFHDFDSTLRGSQVQRSSSIVVSLV